MAAYPQLSILTSIYRGEEYLADFLAQVAAQTLFAQAELVAVLNEGRPAERELLKEFGQQHPGQLQVLEVERVEALGASWNRAWRAARGEYLAIWNIDDCRAPDSLARQVAALEAHPDWALCYGDYVAVPAYGAEEGRRRHTPAFSRGYFARGLPQGGAFWMLRRDASDQVGYFDEQFRVGPDFDYSVRMALAGLRMGRVDGLLGYFTDAAQGLSTRNGADQSAVDRTAIQLRYKILDKVEHRYLDATGQYRMDEVLQFGEWLPLKQLLPNFKIGRAREVWLSTLGWLRSLLRGLLRALGLLGPLHRLLERGLKREL